MRRLAVLLLLLTLPACTTFWSKPGTAQSDLDRDVQFCDAMEAAGAGPPGGQSPGFEDSKQSTSLFYRLGFSASLHPSLEPCLRSQGWHRNS
jgi:hypothetical protein